MPIGDFLKYGIENKHFSLKQVLHKLYFTLYGSSDLHTHIRWRAIKGFIGNTSTLLILDVGSGGGIISLELALKRGATRIVGIDIDPKQINSAKSLKAKLELENVEFIHLDGTSAYPFPDNYFTMALLIDILEHEQKPGMILESVRKVLKPGGIVIVSVPTPNYPKFFGREFHEEIGHVRDGYWHDEILEMMSHYSFRVTGFQYYCYWPSSLACALFYRYLRKIKVIGTITSPLLNLVSHLDSIWPLRNKNFACSLVVRAEKVQ